jgi:serine/threonine protein kinase
MPNDADPQEPTERLSEPLERSRGGAELARGEILSGRYEIQELVGKGGMASVYRAFDRVTEQTIAIKVLDEDRSASRRWVEQLGRELRLARRIKHPNVCQVFDFFDDGGRCYLTMELAPGGTLRDALEAEGRARPLAERVADARAIMDGIAAIHDAGVIHRDLKPENVLRAADRRLMVSDLGVAIRADMTTHTAGPAGTRSYMAPELSFGDRGNKASDVWSLGVILHEVLFGCRPEWSLAGDLHRLNVPEGVSDLTSRNLLEVCAACLVQVPSKRLRDAHAVKQRFEEALGGRSSRRRRRALIAAAVLALAMAAVLVARHRAAVAPRSILTGKAVDLAKSSVPVFTIQREITRCAQLLSGGKTLRLFLRRPLEAVDVDLDKGGASPAKLVPEAMLSGCPQLSPDGRRLLFERPRREGRSHVMLSEWPDGRDAKMVTEGDGPFWLPSGDAFLYAMDTNRSAVFAIGRGPVLFPDDGRGPRVLISHAVRSQGNEIAVVRTSIAPRTQATLDLFSYPQTTLLKRYDLSLWDYPWVEFDEGRHSWQVSLADPIRAVRCELREDGSCDRLMAIDGADVIGSYRSRLGLVAITHRRIRTARLTRKADGKTHEYVTDNWVEFGPGGEALFGMPKATGGWTVALQRFGEPRPRFVSDGPSDLMGSLSSDGRSFIYKSTATTDLNLCSIDATSSRDCRTLSVDPLGPVQPRLSPNGRLLAYEVADAGGPRLRIVTLDGQRMRDLSIRGVGSIRWTSDTTLWMCEADARMWTEVDTVAGRPTGRVIARSDPASVCQPPPGLADLADFEVSRRDEVTTELRLARGM